MILEAIGHGPLVRPGQGSIVAAFKRSAYLDLGDELVCLLPATGPEGAIHARLAVWPEFSRGQPIRLRLDASTPWHPQPWPATTHKLACQRLERFGFEPLGDPLELLGRGEGLTPAGDDRLAGWLIACHALGLSVDARPILLAARTRTHAISQAHLRAAAHGTGCAPFHQVLHDLLDPAIDEPILAPLDLIGHTSGHEAFAGAMAALADFARR